MTGATLSKALPDIAREAYETEEAKVETPSRSSERRNQGRERSEGDKVNEHVDILGSWHLYRQAQTARYQG